MSKTQRTLGPAAFEAYMNFADSLKDGSNNDSIDRFKYRFAVKEGYIRPKKTLTESVGISLEDFEKAFTGLVGAFLPHMDQEDQEILSRVCQNLDERINSGDMAGAMDDLKGAVRSAGGDPDSYDENEDEDDVEYVCDDDDECCDDDECPEGEVCVDGECVPEEEVEDEDDDGDDGKQEKLTEARGVRKPLNDYGKSKYHPWDHCPNITPGAVDATDCNVDILDDPDNYSLDMNDMGAAFNDEDRLYGELNFDDPYAYRKANGFDGDEQCSKKAGRKGVANSFKADTQSRLSLHTPGFQNDDIPCALEPDSYDDDMYDQMLDNDRMKLRVNRPGFSDDDVVYSDSDFFADTADVDYDALADEVLDDAERNADKDRGFEITRPGRPRP